MKIGKIIALLVVFGILFGAVAYIQSQKKGVQTTMRVATTTKMYPGLEESDIFRISVSDREYDSYVVRKNAGVWEVAMGPSPLSSIIRQSQEGDAETEADPSEDTGPDGDSFRNYYKADEEKIITLIEILKDLESGQLTTSDPGQKTQLGVLGALIGTEIHVFDSDMNELVGVILGAPDGNYTSTYIRQPDSDEIYKIDGNPYMQFQKKVADLRSRELFDDAPETINSVNVSDIENGLNYFLSRSDVEWTGSMEDGSLLDLDAAKVDDLLSTLGSLSVTSFINLQEEMQGPPPNGEVWDEFDPFGVLTPLKVIQYQTASSELRVLKVGLKSGSNYYAVIGDNVMDVFKLAASKVDQIAPDPLFLAPEIAVDPLDGIPVLEGIADLEDIEELPVEIHQTDF